MRRVAVWLFSLSAICPVFGQGVEDLAVGSMPIAGDELRARLSGKVFTWRAATSKATARVQYDANGYAFINVAGGQSDSGKWRVEGNQACSEWQRFPSGCGEVRTKGEVLLVKRSDGSWATLTPN